jgi:apoptosis-inducing factor 2
MFVNSMDTQIVCTGQIPQSSILKSLAPQSIKQDGFIQTLKTLQISDERYPNIFAIGDVADTGAHKAAKP